MSSHLQGGNGVQASCAALTLPSSRYPHHQPPACSWSTAPDVLPPCPLSPALWYCYFSHTEWVWSNTTMYFSLGFSVLGIVREFSIIINPNTFECHVSDMPDLFDAPLSLREKKWASDRGRSYCFIDHSKNTLTLGDMLRKLHASLVHSAPTVVHKSCVFVHCVSPHHKWS